jgi:pimeloyl-[acyl-carrier protein] synthase
MASLSGTLVRPIVRPMVINYFLARDWMRSRVIYNPLSSRMHDDPYPSYAKLRKRDPIHWSHLTKGWVFTRYDDIDAILRDWKRFSSADRPARDPDSPLANEPLAMLFQDPPDHTRLRGIVSKAFTPKSIEALRPRIRAIVDELLDAVEDGAPVDIIDALAYPLPVIVIAEMLGVPAADRAEFKAWSNIVARTLEPTITAAEVHEAEEASVKLRDYFLVLVEERRRNPGDDLMSVLIAAEEDGETLSEDELLVTLRLLLVAGNETTTNLIANGLLALLRHPDQLRRLRDNPDLMESAVEELLRFDSPVQTDGRTATADVQFDGMTVRKGERVLLLIGAANHDGEQFTNPEQLDISRDERSHIAFGRGIHHCLGAPLARIEATIAFEGLLERFSDIELAATPRFKDHVVLRGMRELHVAVQS